MTRQFFNTLNQIAHSDSVNPMRGVFRHLQWQGRKMLGRFPCELPIGSSKLFIDHANAVAALVNAMDLYDFNNMSLLKILLSEFGGVFVDVGANVGSYTLVASEAPASVTVSIEPHPRAFQLLCENVKRNRRSNVTCLSFAASDYEGWSDFTDGEELSVNRIAPSCGSRRGIRVPVRMLRSVCHEMKITPEFIKIDVEGHERAVIDGLADMLSATRVMWIERGERPEICAKLQQTGYLGPLYIHYRARRLKSAPTSRPEDPVFVRRDCMPLLESCGFEIQAEGSHSG
jgi:FkbM family methyltransferase